MEIKTNKYMEHEIGMPHCWCEPEKRVLENGSINVIHKKETYEEFIKIKNMDIFEKIERIKDMIAEPTDLEDVKIYNTAVKDVLYVLTGEFLED